MRWNYKKFFAGTLVSVLLINTFVQPLTVVAKSGTGGTGSGSGALEGVLSDVFSVIVPTQPAPTIVDKNDAVKRIFDFILDPHGLAQNGSLSSSTLEPGATVFFPNTGGQYDYSSTSDALTVINKSTTKVDVKVKAELTGMDGIRLTSDNTFKNDSSASVYFALTDSNNKVSAIDKYGAFLRAIMDGQPEAYNVRHISGKYIYEMKSDAELLAGNIHFPEYTFRMSGACNMRNSWAKLPSYLEPQLSVTWIVSLRPKKLAPSIGKTFYVMNREKDIVVDVDLGAGELAAKGIKSITYKNSSGVATVLPTGNYSFLDDKLIFKGAYISSLIDAGLDSREFTVLFDDMAGTRVGITLTSDDVAPFIETAIYKMEEGQPILVPIDLGAGNLGATGIKSITYQNTSGIVTNLPTGNYTFKDGILELSASYISTLIRAGLTSRDYTIILNDKAQTQATITLEINGDAPSIGINSYTMYRGQDIQVMVDLGTDAL